MAQNNAADVEEGDIVTWTYGSGNLGTGRASGEVLRTGLEKFGYDDVIEVAPSNGTPVTHVRPKDLE